MRASLLAISIALVFLCGCTTSQKAASTQIPGWHIYINNKYGYEIQYPDDYDVWETGLEGERDGAAIRIARKEYQAPAPVLDVRVSPRLPVDKFPEAGAPGKDITLGVEDILLNGRPARQAQYRWVVNGDLTLAEVQQDGVVFVFDPAAGTRDFHQTTWWAIISTFRLRGG